MIRIASMASQIQPQVLSDMLVELHSVTDLDLLAVHLNIELYELDKIKLDFQVSVYMCNKEIRSSSPFNFLKLF